MRNNKLRPIRIESDYAYVLLTQGHEAKIDLCDVDKVKDYNWSVFITKNNIYAYRGEKKPNKKGKCIFLHRFLLDAKNGEKVDHKNGIGLDCTRDNIRLCNSMQNCHNRRKTKKSRSIFKGIWKDAQLKKRPWHADIMVKGKIYRLGKFSSEVEAAKAYDNAALKYHGEFACTNKSLGLL